MQIEYTPHRYVLNSFSDILNLDLSRVGVVGCSVPVPRFDREIIVDLLNETLEIVRKWPVLLNLTGNFIIVGDLHGNFFDFVKILLRYKINQETKYIFLGDIVDRGSFSTEVCVLLFALICEFPQNIFLIRGNHEFAQLNEMYGFSSELEKDGYAKDIFYRFGDVFIWLPFAALINGDTLCVHGGISSHIEKVSDLLKIRRPVYGFEDPLIQDIVWSDPSLYVNSYEMSPRGCGHLFGENVVRSFMKENGLKYIFRGHQCVDNGVERFGSTGLYTVFSSSNYNDEMSNISAVVILKPGAKLEFRAVGHSRILERTNTSFFSVTRPKCVTDREESKVRPFLQQYHARISYSGSLPRMQTLKSPASFKRVQHSPTKALSSSNVSDITFSAQTNDNTKRHLDVQMNKQSYTFSKTRPRVVSHSRNSGLQYKRASRIL